MDLSRDGATIRHTPVQDNEGHTSVNDKAPYRFIIAPLDGGEVKYWAATMGFNTGTGGANTDLEASGGSENIGCRAYGTTEFPTGWRMPTQREMMIMWLFREGINAIYSGGKIGQDSKPGTGLQQSTRRIRHGIWISVTQCRNRILCQKLPFSNSGA